MRLTKQKLYKLIREALQDTEEDEQSKKKKPRKIFVLVGPPSVGKSYWMDETFPNKKEIYIINRDDIVTNVASEIKDNKGIPWTYDDLFQLPGKEAKLGDKSDKYGKVIDSVKPVIHWSKFSYDKVALANKEVTNRQETRIAGAAPSGRDIVVDMTNLTAQSRADMLGAIKAPEKYYKKIAVVFEFEGAEEIIKKIAAKRNAEEKKLGRSKTLDDGVFKRMFSAFQRIDPAEGFEEVISVDNREKLRMAVNDMDTGA